MNNSELKKIKQIKTNDFAQFKYENFYYPIQYKSVAKGKKYKHKV